MRYKIWKFICMICAVSVFISCVTFNVSADEPVGRMSAVYGYILNDYIETYGVMSTENKNDALFSEDGSKIAPSGVVYAQVINFDDNQSPYLVLYVVGGGYTTSAVHIWKYNDDTEKAERIAILEIDFSDIPKDQMGEFNFGYNDNKRYISYKTYKDNKLTGAEYYTVIEGDAFEYVNNPKNVTEVGIMDFNAYYFHPGVDVSGYNAVLSDFFDSLKDTAAKSVTFDDMADRLPDEDEAKIEKVLSKAVGFDNFDIKNYQNIDDYNEALSNPKNADRFYLVTNMYNLGDEIYYVRFSTDKSYYNYSLLRRTDEIEDGYQILKIRTDCIPLSDRELSQIKDEYEKGTLLYKKAKGSIKLLRHSKSFVSPNSSNEPAINIEKKIEHNMRFPIACIGGGIAIALLTVLWAFIYNDN